MYKPCSLHVRPPFVLVQQPFDLIIVRDTRIYQPLKQKSLLFATRVFCSRYANYNNK